MERGKKVLARKRKRGGGYKAWGGPRYIHNRKYRNTDTGKIDLKEHLILKYKCVGSKYRIYIDLCGSREEI